MLEVDRLNSSYGPAQILFDLSLRVGRGEVVALLGRNGAGKSTTLRSLIGLGVSRRGRIVFAGANISTSPAWKNARLGLGYVPEDRRVFTGLTVEENLMVGRRPARPDLPEWTPERLFALFPNLAPMRARRGGEMSGGEQQMLTIARTLMGNPALVLLDEPSEGLAPRIVDEMADAVLEMKRAGLSLLVSEQNLHFARLISDRAYVIERGRIRYEGSIADLEAEPGVRDAYLAV